LNLKQKKEKKKRIENEKNKKKKKIRKSELGPTHMGVCGAEYTPTW
jgi:hypothetical protein